VHSFLPTSISGELLATLLIAGLALAVFTDVRTHRIPNWLNFSLLAAGVTLNVVRDGAGGFLFSIEGIAVASISLILFLLAGGLGAGDVKLLWAIGALAGPHFTIWTLLGMALSGGALAIAFAARRRELRGAWQNALVGSHVLATTGRSEAIKSAAAVSRVEKMPYAPAIALGAALAAYLVYSGMMSL
jgi:prepilin peptidase CpaA